MRRTKEESADTRRALIAAATLEFAERGYQGASLRSICAAAHVTTGALYFLFAGKGELFERTVGPTFDQVELSLRAHYRRERARLGDGQLRDLPEGEDLAAGLDIYDICARRPQVVDAVLANREHPYVRGRLAVLTQMASEQAYLTLGEDALKNTSMHGMDGHTIEWLAQLQIDSVLGILSEHLSRQEFMTRLSTVVRFLRGGAIAVVMGEDLPDLLTGAVM